MPALHWWWFWQWDSTFCCWWHCVSSSSSTAHPQTHSEIHSVQQSSCTVFLFHCQDHLGNRGEPIIFFRRFCARNVSPWVRKRVRVGVLAWDVCFQDRNPDSYTCVWQLCIQMINNCVSARCWVTNYVCFASEHGKRQHVKRLAAYICCEIYLVFNLCTDNLITKEYKFVIDLVWFLMQYRLQAVV